MGGTGFGMWTAAPAERLRPYVEAYRGYRLPDVGPGFHRGVPSRHMTFIASIGQPIEVVDPSDRSRTRARYGTVMAGLSTTHAVIAYDGTQEGVAIEMTPLGWHALFGMPVKELSGEGVEATAVMGALAEELRERLHETPAWGERFAVCDDVLARTVPTGGEPHGIVPGIAEAWRLLVASGGTIAVRDVASEVGWSRRHLAARFQSEFGISPKAMARVVRFERACRVLVGGRFRSIAEVAARCGYSDQSHLNREFVALAGCPPGEWLATELATDFPNVQDEPVEPDDTAGHDD